jgi:hypothetical protein
MRAVLLRPYVWVLLLLAAAAAGYGVHRATRLTWQETEAWRKYEQIRLGMSWQNVETALGPCGATDGDRGGWFASWRVGDDYVMVRVNTLVNPYGLVGSKSAVIQGREFSDPPGERETSWWDRWRARLGW